MAELADARQYKHGAELLVRRPYPCAIKRSITLEIRPSTPGRSAAARSASSLLPPSAKSPGISRFVLVRFRVRSHGTQFLDYSRVFIFESLLAVFNYNISSWQLRHIGFKFHFRLKVLIAIQ